MKLSELKPIVKEARRLGLKKLPNQSIWHISYRFDECEAHFYISSLELIYSNVPLKDMLNNKYKEFWRKYKEKFHVKDAMGIKELKVYLKEENK